LGGGILALAGGNHHNVYYNFLPVDVTPAYVTPSPGSPGNPETFKLVPKFDFIH
jgi:hypothetical protein